MDRRKVAVLYDEYVVQPDLERTALLQLLLTICGRMPTLLYPGCSIHITPSFHFQHVVYVDLSELARKFFAQEQGILDVINHQKRYRQNPFVRFIAQDFTTALPLPPASFDVLLSLYAGGIARSCNEIREARGDCGHRRPSW